MKLFERILLEASKRRYIDKVWNDPKFLRKANCYLRDGCEVPTAEEMAKWIDSGAADPYLKSIKMDWQTFSIDRHGISSPITPLFVELIEEYNLYKHSGGSRAARKLAAYDDPKQVFRNADKMLICEDEGSDTSDCDFVLLNSFENDDWIFVVPMTWEAACFMDSYKCGGQGAKWCIGMETTPQYFRDYVKNGNLFVLAYSKNEHGLRYMIQICPDGDRCTQAWDQLDNASIRMKDIYPTFGHTPADFLRKFQEKIFCDDNCYSDAADDDIWARWLEDVPGVDER